MSFLLKPFRIFNCLLVAGIAHLAAPATQVGANCYFCNWDEGSNTNYCDDTSGGKNGNQQCDSYWDGYSGCNVSGPTCTS